MLQPAAPPALVDIIVDISHLGSLVFNQIGFLHICLTYTTTAMTSEGHKCPGCDSIFTRQGIISHLHQTMDPLCRREAARLRDSTNMYESSDSGSSSADSLHEAPEILPQESSLPSQVNRDDTSFDTLAFNSDEEAWEEDPLHHPASPDSMSGSEEEDIMYADLEGGWEAPRETVPINKIQDEEVETLEDIVMAVGLTPGELWHSVRSI